MANIRFKLPLLTYGNVMEILSNATVDGAEGLDDVIKELSNDVRIINTEDEPIDKLVVQIKIDADYMGTVFKYIVQGSKLGDSVSSVYVDKLVKTYRDELEARAKEIQRQAEFDTWITSCFDKYITSADEPSCKELTDIVNKNELKDGMQPIKYQNIARSLKAYRKEKFGA